jgi:hypothetical protein
MVGGAEEDGTGYRRQGRARSIVPILISETMIVPNLNPAQMAAARRPMSASLRTPPAAATNLGDGDLPSVVPFVGSGQDTLFGYEIVHKRSCGNTRRVFHSQGECV